MSNVIMKFVMLHAQPHVTTSKLEDVTSIFSEFGALFVTNLGC